jgi:hypothetical protein
MAAKSREFMMGWTMVHDKFDDNHPSFDALHGECAHWGHPTFNESDVPNEDTALGIKAALDVLEQKHLVAPDMKVELSRFAPAQAVADPPDDSKSKSKDVHRGRDKGKTKDAV